MKRRKVVIMGAAGRDFHNFNCFFRNNEAYEVIAFTATQIPDIEGRAYPFKLAGKLYPDGIPIVSESELPEIIKQNCVDLVVFAYSDVSYDYLMHKGAMVNACGADFMLQGAAQTQISSSKPVVAVCATRTGCGKSQTTRAISDVLRKRGLKVVAIRHPMPYGNLEAQIVQRFATLEDLEKHHCTIEEMEEYEPHIDNGVIVYAGVDYERILREAEKEADIILWDGGNNDMAFYKSDLYITVADPHRAGHEIRYYPGETNLHLANIIIINKIDTAQKKDIEIVRANVKQVNPSAVIIEAESPIKVHDPDIIRNKRVLVVEDGPTLTHGEMKFGAGVVAARKFGAAEIVDPRPFTVASIKETFDKYPGIGNLLPAMGYGKEQMRDLELTIAQADADSVVIGTPIDLRRIIDIKQPSTRVQYDLGQKATEMLEKYLDNLLKEKGF
ncbi:GTPase [bacterium]|nr:GTPase [candidate division CSSED10-310 bacterium]